MTSTFIGQGNFGKVYKETRKGKVCAVKKIPNYSRFSASDEAKLLMSLDNDYIIKYLEQFEKDGCLCIVMEWADVGTWEKHIKEEANNPATTHFDEYNVWRGLAHLTNALSYLHTRHPHILHRDIKPDNILGQTQSCGRITWKLADFGIAKLLTDAAQGEYYGTAILAHAPYMAPEVRACLDKCTSDLYQVIFDYKKYNMASDVWSVGCLMAFRCKRGSHLFRTTGDVINWTGPYVGDIGASSNYSEDLINVLGRMVYPDHHDRPSAGEVRMECTHDRQEAWRLQELKVPSLASSGGDENCCPSTIGCWRGCENFARSVRKSLHLGP
jgi:serine/threonine protein kinase